MATLVTGVPDTRAVNGKPLSSDVTLAAADVGADPSGSSSAAVTQHEAKAGAHPIAGVNGLQAALDGKEASGAAASAVAAHKSGTDQHSISGVTGLQAALDSLAGNSGDPVLSPKWIQKRSAMWTGYAPQDGQLLSRALYPDAFAGILAGMLPVCSDADWLANPGMRGCATLGDGSTTFRLPDLNGAQPGSYGPVYLGGGTTDGGAILRDRIQDFELSISLSPTLSNSGDPNAKVGSFTRKEPNSSGDIARTNSNGCRYAVSASELVRAGSTTRPITVEGCIAIKLFGAVQNTGSADAAALATAVAALAARVTALEARKFTTLIPATYPSGAPHDTHETVDAVLPASILNNNRYVLTNPFGVNTRVDVKVEIWHNGKWADPGWVPNGTGSASGARAEYVQGEGIILQTGLGGLAGNANLTGSGSGATGGSIATIATAPCRVAVRKWEA